MTWGSLQLAGTASCFGGSLNMTGEHAARGFLPVFDTEAEAEAFRASAAVGIRHAQILRFEGAGDGD